jgi:flagellar basal-body rod protein FlgG
MNVSLYQAAAALNASARWQEMISQNLAAASVPGFKKQEISFAAIQSGLLAGKPLVLPGVSTATNFVQGELRSTGVPTDLAIEGRGFFEIQLPDGTTGYTRDGEFHLDAQGQLVTKQGHPVLASGGTVQLDPRNPAPLTVSADGEISQGADNKGRLTITDFNDTKLLLPAGNGCFIVRDPKAQPTTATAARLHQGYLEAANTTPVAEMSQLITAMRSFEANQRVLQLQDERLGRVIAELGNPSL